MKKTLFIIGLAVIIACSGNIKENKETPKIADKFYGEKIDNNNIAEYSLVKEEVEKNGISITKIQGEILSTCANNVVGTCIKGTTR